MKISFAILASNKAHHLGQLLFQLSKCKHKDDEICVLGDTQTVTEETRNIIKQFNVKYDEHPLEQNFGRQKTILRNLCSGEWIFNIDDDELLSLYMSQYYREIILRQEVDAIWVPRINLVEGITIQHITEWNWQISKLEQYTTRSLKGDLNEDKRALIEKYRLLIKEDQTHITYHEPIINFPDMQCRIYRNIPQIYWTRPVHEQLQGYKDFVQLPYHPDFCLIHKKNIVLQEKQNNFYSKI